MTDETEEEKRGRGAPPHVPTKETRRTVVLARGCRMNVADIALCLGISVRTLDKYYKHEIHAGKALVDMKVANAMMKKIEQGDSALIKFYMTNQMTFEEKAAQINVENNLTITDASIPEFNKWLAGVLTRPAPEDGKTIEQDRPLLPAPVRSEPA